MALQLALTGAAAAIMLHQVPLVPLVPAKIGAVAHKVDYGKEHAPGVSIERSGARCPSAAARPCSHMPGAARRSVAPRPAPAPRPASLRNVPGKRPR